jgi:regulatory protein
MTAPEQRRGRRPRTAAPQDGVGGDDLVRASGSGRGGSRGGKRGGRARDPLPDAQVEPTPEADPESVARAIVLRQLTMTARTRSQLETILAKRDVPPAVATKVLDRMTEVGLIDDAAYAEAWVRTRHADRGLARRALAQELRQRGVDDEIARDALDAIDLDDERERALALVRRKAPSTRGLEPAVRTRRLAGMLARKGYSSGVAFAVVREVLGEQAADEALTFEPDAG